MQSVSQLWASVFEAEHTVRYRARIEGAVYEDDSISDIHITKRVMDSIAIGSCCASTLEMTFKPFGTVPRMAEIELYARLVPGSGTASEWLPQGTFYIDTRETDIDGFMTVTAYDAMLKGDQVFLDGMDDEEWPITMTEAVTRACSLMGTSLDGRTAIKEYVLDLPNYSDLEIKYNEMCGMVDESGNISAGNLSKVTADLDALCAEFGLTYTITGGKVDNFKSLNKSIHSALYKKLVDYPSGYNIREVLCNIAAANGGNFIITESGKLRLVPLISPPGTAVSYPCSDVSLGSGVTISRVTLYDDAGDAFTAGDDTGYHLEADCLYASQEIADDLCNTKSGALYGVIYKAYECTDAVIDPALELGDGLALLSGVYAAMSLDITADALYTANSSAPLDEEVDHEYPYKTRTERDASRAVKAGIEYYGNSISRKDGFISRRTDGDKTLATAQFNADTFAFYDSEGKAQLCFDPVSGMYKFSGTINVGDGFIVDSKGNVTISGGIKWTESSNPFKTLYSDTYVPPVQYYAEYIALSRRLDMITDPMPGTYYKTLTVDSASGGVTFSDGREFLEADAAFEAGYVYGYAGMPVLTDSLKFDMVSNEHAGTYYKSMSYDRATGVVTLRDGTDFTSMYSAYLKGYIFSLPDESDKKFRWLRSVDRFGFVNAEDYGIKYYDGYMRMTDIAKTFVTCDICTAKKYKTPAHDDDTWGDWQDKWTNADVNVYAIYSYNGGVTYGDPVLVQASGKTPKLVTLRASRLVFKYSSDGSLISPSDTVTFTAVLQNCTGTVTWSASPSVTLTKSGNTAALKASNMGNNGQIVVTAALGDYSDSITISSLSDGADAYAAILTNEAHVMACSSDGTPESGELGTGTDSLGKAKTGIQAYRGSTMLSLVSSTSELASGKFCYALSSSGCSVNRYGATIYLTAAGSDSGYVDITIYCESVSNVITKRFSWSKSKAGSDASATTWDQINSWLGGMFTKGATVISNSTMYSPTIYSAKIYAGEGNGQYTIMTENGLNVYDSTGLLKIILGLKTSSQTNYDYPYLAMGASDLGSARAMIKKFVAAAWYGDATGINNTSPGGTGMEVSTGEEKFVRFKSASTNICYVSANGLYPSADNGMNFGLAAQRWKNIYAYTTTISTSDRQEKKDIEYDMAKYEKLFFALKPTQYKFVVNESDRYHTGFIAQDVEDALANCGLSSQDFAGYIKSPVYSESDMDGNPKDGASITGYSYGLRYEEFIALNTHMIQGLCGRVEALEAKLNGEVTNG